jgi:hypothetical protein
MSRTSAFMPSLLALLVAGCSGTPDKQANAANETAAPASEARPATGENAAAPAAIVSAGDSLAGYAGRYPNDEVDGETFLDDIRVRAAVAAAVADGEIRGRILDGRGTYGPIRMGGNRLTAPGCESHNCGDHNWAILIDASVDNIEVCYHDAASMAGRSRWYRADRAAEMRAGDCPQE